ncbi:MAG TPA: hypothetical protein VFI72_16825, partial [Candidatus Angelobacter sp.]|nr:hypothetical protein [Candidatus Angelobacter sp.]
MSKELFVSSTPHETKVAVVEEDQLTEIYYERENEYTLAGSIYKGRVTRVLPGMQSAFVNIGLERDAFLYVSDFLLEEEDDTDGLEQVVSRSRPVITEPHGSGEDRGPLDAQEVFPAAAQIDEEESDEEPSVEAHGEPAGEEDQKGEGARKWRGRRRRRGRGGRYDRDEQRPAAAPQQESTPENRPEARPEPVHESRHESHSEARNEHRHDTRHDRHEREPRRESRYGSRNEQEPELEPIVLPGESISKYQPPSAQTATESRPSAPVRTSRPSTEYSIDPSQFTPGSVTLPGESLAKYKGDGPQRSSRAVAGHETNAPSHEPEHGLSQDSGSAGPVPAQAEVSSHRQEVVAVALPHPEASHDEETSNLEGDRQAKHEAERFAPMKVTPIFASEDAEGEEFQEVELEETQQAPQQHHATVSHSPERDSAETQPAESHEHGAHATSSHADIEHDRAEHVANVANASPATTSEGAPQLDSATATAPVSIPTGHETSATEQTWKATGRGVVEEEVIEEEESDLPAYEDDLDLGEFEELEEENFVPMGRELTEAVRDAHINEHATGQYEAEGLEEGGEADEEDDFDEEGHPAAQMLDGDAEVEELEAGEHMEEGADGTQTERHAAGAQQQRSDRRPHDRRGRSDQRRPGRRIRGRRPHTPQRQLPAISDLLK